MKKLICLMYFCFMSEAYAVTNIMKIESSVYNKEKLIQIELPESYASSGERRYPVMYVLHSQWDLSLVTAIAETMSAEIPEFIVVGVEGEGSELHPVNGKKKESGHEFRRFVENELMVHLKRKFRVAHYNVLVGHSNAGRFALEQFLSNSKLYEDYFVFSPSLEDGYLVDLAKKSKGINGYAFLSIANEGEHMQQPFEQLTTILKNKPELTFESRKYLDYSHQSSKTVALVNALQSRFKNWVPSDQVKISGFDKLMKHYQALEMEFGFKAYPDMNSLIRIVGYSAINGKEKEVGKFSQFMLNHYPSASDSLLKLRDYLSAEGFNEAAKLIVL